MSHRTPLTAISNLRALPRSPAGFGRLVALLLVTAVTAAAALQPLRITGRVVDDVTGRAIPGVQVTVVGARATALTDRDGRYTLVLPETVGETELRIAAAVAGYEPAVVTFAPSDATNRESLTLDFRLRLAPRQEKDRPTEELEAVRLPAEIALPAPAADRAATGQGAVLHARAMNMRPGVFHPGDREQYAHIEENAFRSALDHPLSTFSIDVDRASYSNVRRFLLREGRLPPVDAVQVEEMINYFPYDYVRPWGEDPVAVTTEMGAAPWRPEHRLLRIGLASAPVRTEDLPPANLVFLLDVSGSMNAPDKLPLVKRAMGLLVDQMREEDRVAIVVYAGAAGLVLEPTSGAHRERILEALQRLEAGGSTAGGAGLRLAYDVARRHFVPGGNNRVILATDGDFNVGESSDAAMTRLVEERREEGTFLTVLGFGTGNLQNTKMQEMAQHGNGNYAYIDGVAEARKVLVGEMGGTLLTVAKDVKLQVEFNPARVRAYRLVGYENRLLAAEDFNDDTKDAGELGAGHTVTALYEIVPVGSGSDVTVPTVDPLRYRDGGEVEATRARDASAGSPDGELAFVKVRYKRPDGDTSRLIEHPVRDRPDRMARSADFRFASAVAGFGMLLRESEYRGVMTADQVLALARSGLGEDAHGYRQGFLELVRAYRSLVRPVETDGAPEVEPDRYR